MEQKNSQNGTEKIFSRFGQKPMPNPGKSVHSNLDSYKDNHTFAYYSQPPNTKDIEKVSKAAQEERQFHMGKHQYD